MLHMIKTEGKQNIIYKPFINEDSPYKGGGKKIQMSDGRVVHKLSSNENPLGFSDKVKGAILEAMDNLSLYPDNTDIRLRESLVANFDHQLTADHFVTANSGSEIIDLIAKVFLSEDDEVILSQPCFLPYITFTRWMGANANNVPLTAEYDFDLQGILDRINSKTRLIFLSSPNNPSGNYIPFKDFEVFLTKIPKNVIIVFDEVYRHFAESSDYTTALPFILKGYNIVAINSFSKTYGLAGLRVGYCYSNIEISNYIRKVCKPFLMSSLALEGAIAALEDTDFVKRTIDFIRYERKFVLEGLEGLGIAFWPTEGNFVMIKPPIDCYDFVRFMEKKGIMVRPLEAFGAPGKIRITFGTREANIALLAAIRDLQNGKS